MTTEEVAIMKRKSCVMCLMFNLLECSVHLVLHSAGHKEEGVGARGPYGASFCGCISLGKALKLRGTLRHEEGK